MTISIEDAIVKVQSIYGEGWSVDEVWFTPRVVVVLVSQGELLGAGPVVVDRTTGAVTHVGSAVDPATVVAGMTRAV